MKKCDFCGEQETEDNQCVINKKGIIICRACSLAALYLIDTGNSSVCDTNLEGPKKDLETYEELLQDDDFFDEYIKNDLEGDINLMSPKDLKSILDKYIIGQDNAKKVLSISVYNHYKKLNNSTENDLNKNNVILLGNSGVGKTALVSTLAKYLDLPMALVNTTSLTSAGYIGEDVVSVLERLYENSDNNLDLAEQGIIFLDEIDKNATSGGGTNNKDVSGKAVQQELLKMLESDEVEIYKDSKTKSTIKICTKNILFIAAGAFVGLRDNDSTIKIKALGSKIHEQKDTIVGYQKLLEDYGLIPEFIGRFANIVELEPLDKKTLKRILTEPKNNLIDQYTELFSLSNVKINFSEKFVNYIISEAIGINTGARSLGAIMENSLNEIMFNIDDYEDESIIVDYSYNKIKAHIINEKERA